MTPAVSCETQKVVPSEQDSIILPNRVANQSARFCPSCPIIKLLSSHNCYDKSFSVIDEGLSLLGSKRQVSACRKFLQGLEPIDREDWCRSNCFWKLILIVKVNNSYWKHSKV